jgi:hypothetical protein
VSSFGPTLERLMLRAGAWDTTLARRIGVSRSEVFRWRTGRAVPSPRNLARLEHALRWPSENGLQELTTQEQDLLRTLSGHTSLDVGHAPELSNRVELPDRCTVHAYQYAPRNFPSQWARRMSQIERTVQGAMHCMLQRPPSFMRPDSVTQIYTRWYDEDVVQQFVDDLRERREEFERRVSEYEVRHIYSKSELQEFLRTRRWQDVELTPEQMREHVAMIVGPLDEYYPNYAIGLDDDPLPFDAMIVGHEVVLLTLREANMVNAAGWMIFGMEMTGLSVVKTFSQAFDRTWGKRTVVRDPQQVKAWFYDQF